MSVWLYYNAPAARLQRIRPHAAKSSNFVLTTCRCRFILFSHINAATSQPKGGKSNGSFPLAPFPLHRAVFCFFLFLLALDLFYRWEVFYDRTTNHALLQRPRRPFGLFRRAAAWLRAQHRRLSAAGRLLRRVGRYHRCGVLASARSGRAADHPCGRRGRRSACPRHRAGRQRDRHL